VVNSTDTISGNTSPRSKILIVAVIILFGFLVLSGLNPYDRLTWLMEVLPVIIAVPILWKTYSRYPLTNLLYIGIFIHALVLILGGAYTYARVPIGYEFAEWFGLDRNPYDKLGHLFQGFVPALIAREILLRGNFVRGRKMLVFIILCIVLAIAAAYELIEWWAALIVGEGAHEFLGTQGYEWDTQADMFFALIGGAAALLLLSRVHDQQLKNFLR
jgi:putative membrane protein